jgi:hypothetical protein
VVERRKFTALGLSTDEANKLYSCRVQLSGERTERLGELPKHSLYFASLASDFQPWVAVHCRIGVPERGN